VTKKEKNDAGQEEHRLIAERRRKLDELRSDGFLFPNSFRRTEWAEDLHARFVGADNDVLDKESVEVSVAGRMMAKRVMGKVAFTHIQDASGQIQLFLQRDALPDGVYQGFKNWDVGDIVGASGTLFRPKTGELSVRVGELQLLTKSLRALPEKFHGLADQEIRYRQRYVDLIMNESTRRTFRARSKIIKEIRAFMEEREFLEVETPMMQLIPGGAVARPFITHHNALDLDLYLRVAPELFLKRLVVGGFERVYEINRNFRNEGVSTQHNPEFTMLEFYQAYADYEDFITLSEDMLRHLADKVLGTRQFEYQGHKIDLDKPFARMTMRDAVLSRNDDLREKDLRDEAALRKKAKALEIAAKKEWGAGKLLSEIFEKTVEDDLIQPTFITHYPTEVSPLSRRNDGDPSVTDRFELFIGGHEVANGFSELNDVEDQAERFRAQVKARDTGDHEAMAFDSDYIRALEYGLPPTAGEGVGIDRLVMVLTDSASIRDVLLFPYMRPETK
jgi:lysyl-tRNA synthetase class 2